MSTLWSGRFDSEPNAAVFDFGASFRFDRRLFEDDVIGSLAWAEALKTAGALSDDDAAAIAAALHEILAKGQADPAWVSGPDEDVHSFVERQLVERIGDTGRRLHTGRSRNEQVSLDLRLFLRRRIALAPGADPAVDRGLCVAGRALRRRAHARLHAPAPGAAGADRALPARARGRDAPRPCAVSARPPAEADALPLGSGAVAGTNYAIDTASLARDARLLARRRQQHRRVRRSRLRVGVPPCLRADDGASEPICRRHGDLQRRGVRVLRAVGRLLDRQQHDAAEEEPRPAGAGARQVRAAPSAISPDGSRR